MEDKFIFRSAQVLDSSEDIEVKVSGVEYLYLQIDDPEFSLQEFKSFLLTSSVYNALCRNNVPASIVRKGLGNWVISNLKVERLDKNREK